MTSRDVRFDFSGNTVLVTGGTRSIGLAIARAFHEARATVHITGTRTGPGEYQEDLSDFIFHRCEMRDPEQILALANAIPTIDVLVNNAGMNIRPPAGATVQGFDETLTVNLSAVYQMSHALRPGLKESKGSIVNIGSLNATFGSPSPGYSAAKAGIVNLTMSLASTWAEDGIRVNNVAPGWTKTEMNEDLRSDPSLTEAVIKHTPLGRWGDASDIAHAVLFLASDRASFITGVTLPVDGGFPTRW